MVNVLMAVRIRPGTFGVAAGGGSGGCESPAVVVLCLQIGCVLQLPPSALGRLASRAVGTRVGLCGSVGVLAPGVTRASIGSRSMVAGVVVGVGGRRGKDAAGAGPNTGEHAAKLALDARLSGRTWKLGLRALHSLWKRRRPSLAVGLVDAE